MQEFEDIIRKKRLPRVGQTVRSKDCGTLCRVMEKRELWQTIKDPQTKSPAWFPPFTYPTGEARKESRPAWARVMGYTYTLYDNTFELHWEIVF